MPQEPSQNLTSEQMRQRIEETDVEEAAPVEEAVETEGVETTETEPIAETEGGELALEEEPKPAKPEKEEVQKLYKLKVKGQVREFTEDEMIARAQMGEDYNIKMQKVREKERELEQKATQSGGPFGNVDPQKFNEFLIKNLNEDPGGTLLNLYGVMEQNKEKSRLEEKRQEREFKNTAAEQFGDQWAFIRGDYEEYREEGHSRETALALSQANFYRTIAEKAMERGMKKGAKKADAKLRAEIPSGTKKTKVTTGLPTPEQAKKMTSKELAKYLKRFQNPNW